MARSLTRLAAGGASALLGLPLAAAASWIAYSALAIDHAMPLPRAIDAEQGTFSDPSGARLNAYVDRSARGRPLVLIHSINAAASAYELRPLFEHYRPRRPVWALDLPGFGFSERADRVYSPQLYESAILQLLTRQVGEPADVVALSLGGEFAARATQARPELVRSLALISPTGFAAGRAGRASQRTGQARVGDRVYQALSFPLWGQALYDLIATQRSIRYFLQQSFVGPVDNGMAEYAYLTAHQPGARYAPLYFLSGQLFTPEVRQRVYARLSRPALVIYDQDAYTQFDALPAFLDEHPDWRSARITPTRGLPQFEKLPATTQALDAFWQSHLLD